MDPIRIYLFFNKECQIRKLECQQWLKLSPQFNMTSFFKLLAISALRINWSNLQPGQKCNQIMLMKNIILKQYNLSFLK